MGVDREPRFFRHVDAQVGWWLNSLKRHDSLNSDGINGQIRFFDQYIVPVSKALNPLFRSFFGQSTICVARCR
jgi:hypothetical protein